MSQNNNLYYRQVILNLNYNVCKKTLQALHQEDKTRWVTTGLIQTKTSEWWDELFPFSNINRIIK